MAQAVENVRCSVSKLKVVQPKKEKQPRQKTKKPFARNKIAAVLTAVIVVVGCAALLVWALPGLPLKPQTQQPLSYQGVVELWNVETFEGGVGSRESWLINRAAKFESANKGLFVHVTTLTVEQAESKLNEGQAFDMICFSRGVGSLVKEHLKAFSGSVGAIKDNYLVSGQLEGSLYAVPLYSGAYCLFSRAEQLSADRLLAEALTAKYTRKVGKNTFELQPLTCGFTPYNSPLSALAFSGGKGKAKVDDTVTQYQAYEQFVANKTAVTLLGTQRDVYRLSQRESNGKIENLAFQPLYGYTDLVQYLSVSQGAGEKTESCERFIEYLTSEQAQSTLTNMSLFSVLDATFYTADRYAQCESSLATAYIPNVFGDADAIAKQRQTAIATLNM